MVSLRIRKCPDCGHLLVPVRYGYPTPELFELAEVGKVMLGGCCLPEVLEKKTCRNCGWTLLENGTVVRPEPEAALPQ